MRRQLFRTIFILLCVCGVLAGGAKGTVHAKTEEPVDSFSGDVAVLKQEDSGYVMQVTVENDGEDFTGTVQVVFAGSDVGNCAYHTDITLPAQGKKQFTLNVARTAADTTRGGVCALNFVEESGDTLQSIQLKNLFENAMTEIMVGVLSDDFDSLAFLEADGETIDIRNRNYPLKLVELNGDNLEGKLDQLYYLIIDRFDVSSLGRGNIEAIQDWVRGGGRLMVGTGEYGDKTLSGFDQDFMDVSVLKVSAPGEENVLSDNAEPYGYYYTMYTNDGIDFTGMAVADLDYDRTRGSFFESSDNPAICSPVKMGAVSVFFCSLGDAELQKLSSYTAASIYEELTYSGYAYDEASEWGYVRERALSFIDNLNTNVDFTGLRVMILLYVVLAGPVLYLILRRCKKCEWYWLCVPALGVLFIVGVYILGQGTRVKDTRVYSVTAQRVDDSRKDTYFLAYRAGIKPWEISLREEYETAGPGSGGDSRYYYGGYSQNVDGYFYTVGNDSAGLSAGIMPRENFDNGFFYAEGRAESKGEISCADVRRVKGGEAGGTVTNGTDCDMAYMALLYRDNIMVFSDVKAGETIDLQRDSASGRCVYKGTFYSIDDLLYDMVSVYGYHSELGYEQDDMAALLIGLGVADQKRPAGRNEIWGTDRVGQTKKEQMAIVGVVRDYERVSAGKCRELSYGCLYSYAEMEGGQDASN